MKNSAPKRASVTINSIITMFFIICIVLSSTIATKSLYKLSRENKDMHINDYESSLAESVCQINAYYSIEDAYINSSNSQEFIYAFSNFNSKYYNNIFKKNYYYDEKVKIDYYDDKKNIKLDKDFIEFSLVISYRDNSIARSIIKRCRIENPYSRFHIYKNDKKVDLKTEELKELFYYLN